MLRLQPLLFIHIVLVVISIGSGLRHRKYKEGEVSPPTVAVAEGAASAPALVVMRAIKDGAQRRPLFASVRLLAVVAALVSHLFIGASGSAAPLYVSELNERLFSPHEFLATATVSSPCSVHHGCPQGSMVWATGTFTAPNVLTPASFLVAANLTLQLNLCCGYKFNGRLLREASRYDTFLYDLLRSTPFHTLTIEEKRNMFPREKIVIFDSQHEPQRRYDGLHGPSMEETQQGNDGDGDVMVLVTGAVGAGIHRTPLQQPAVPSAFNPPFVGLRGGYSAPLGSYAGNRTFNGDRGVSSAVNTSADVQLRVSNVAIKCKCPHTLLVMPVLRAHADALPSMSLVGLGSRCGVGANLEGAATGPEGGEGDTIQPIVQLASGDWAASFALQPPLLPATLVYWVVTDNDVAAGGNNVALNLSHYTALRHQTEDSNAVQPQVATSGYFNVIPHHNYSVTVTVSRGAAKQTLSGAFTLRLPLPLEGRGVHLSNVTRLHFGVDRRLRLSRYTRGRRALKQAFATSPDERRPSHVGYWVRMPTGGELLESNGPPSLLLVHNPYDEEFARYPLTVGRNVLSYYVRDVDEVCEPVLLEVQELWAVQAMLLEPSTSPVTICDDKVSLKAFGLKRLLETMRSQQQIPVRLVGDLSWEDLNRLGGASNAVEGHFNCTESDVGPCHIVVEGGGGHTGVLQMLKRGVAELAWVVSVEVNTSQLRHIQQLQRRHDGHEGNDDDEGAFEDYLDPSLARVISSGQGLTVVEVRSRSVLIVRRVSALPRQISVELFLHQRRLTVRAPRPFFGQPGGELEKNGEVVDAHIIGRWVVNPPMSLISVDEAYTAELDTSTVPNIQQNLPEGTLQFIVEDPGEAVQDKLLSVSYTSRCPPRIVEFAVSRVAVAAPPIKPEFVPVYTEDSCVLLPPPREAQKDEDVQWDIRPCPEASATPYFVGERERMELTKGYNGSSDDVIAVCGVEVDHWCEVVWRARNLAGSVSQTFSLRRCQRPPYLLFHKSRGGGGRDSGLSIDTYSLPSVEWLDDTVAVDNNGTDITASNNGDYRGSVAAAREQDKARYFTRRVIPVAGYAATVHYAFDYSGPQSHYEVDFQYSHDAAHQLHVTGAHFERGNIAVDGSVGKGLGKEEGYSDPDDTFAASTAPPLLLRRFARPPAVGVAVMMQETGFNRTTSDDGVGDADTAYWEVERHHDDYKIDRECDARFSYNNSHAKQYVQLQGFSNSSNYPIQYNVRPSSATVAATAESPTRRSAAEEFARRGMCLSRPGNVSFLSLNPRGLVDVIGERDIAFCGPTFKFSRHPWLHTKYYYDFTWTCGSGSKGGGDTDDRTSDGAMRVEKHSPTFSVLHEGVGGNKQCTLTIHNKLTETLQAETFVMRRVHPTSATLNFSVLSNNWASGNCSMQHSKRKSSSSGLQAATTVGRSYGGEQGKTQGVVGGARTHWIVGKRAVLHVDPPADIRTSQWRITAVVPEEPSSIGTQRLLDSLQIIPLRQPHPRVVARGGGGATVLLANIRVPGMYTLSHQHVDAAYPNVCPNVTVTETLHVTHARVLERELTVCGDTAVLRAVPLPPTINCSFVALWEVVSVQTAENVILTDKASLAGIKFGDVRSPRTTVHGLPFGIVTVRWSVYASVGDGSEEAQGPHGQLVDYDAVRLLVLTENLRSARVVTLSSSVEVLVTGSTLGWRLLKTADHKGSSLLSGRGPTVHIGSVSGNQSAGGASHNENHTRDARAERALLVENLPVGATVLQYELHASPRLFGAMLGRRCPFVHQQLLTIERVSAFLSVNTTLSHECDAYSGRGRLSICLHAEGIKSTVSADAVAAGEGSSYQGVGVRLVAPDNFERVVKTAAERLATNGCWLPWWVARSTDWSDFRVDSSQKCISFSVVAKGHHLQPKEVSHYLFLAQERLGLPQLCTYTGGDFIPSDVIEGASTWSVGGSPEEASWFRFRSRSAAEASKEVSRFLPFMNPSTLTREDQVMRPLLGQLGVPDVVISELDISEGGGIDTEKAHSTNKGTMRNSRNSSVEVVFRLDRSQPGRMAGFLYAETAHPNDARQEKHDNIHHKAREGEGGILTKCVRGTLIGSEVLKLWAEVNQPDGAAGSNPREWDEYTQHVGAAQLKCEPLFISLERLLRLPDDTESSLRIRRANFVPSREERFVTLEVMEQQLKALREEFRLTRDGIDVTGLRPEVQQALSHRRITRSQLDEIEKARREKAEKEQQLDQRQQQLGLTDASNAKTLEGRFATAVRLYKGVIGEDVSAIRVKLPYYGSFSVPHNLFLRTGLHKDTICGTNVSATSTAPASLVQFSRVEVMDEPPAVGVSPPVIKQCEIEGRIPTININVSGTRFVSGGTFPQQDVVLEELANPNVTTDDASLEGSMRDVGLGPCLAQMRAGMEVRVSSPTRRHLSLQLSPCPSFQMLSAAEYNERQDSAQLLRRLKLPRLLRVTLRGALAQDSHTRGRTSISFVVEVRPTLALLHVRPLPRQEGILPVTWDVADRTRPLLVCEADLLYKGVELGVELIGDVWNPRVGEGEGDYNDDSGDVEHHYDNINFDALMAKGSNEKGVVDGGLLSNGGRQLPDRVNGESRAELRRRKRPPHNVALLNSFSIVEHHSFDSVHHLFLQQGGVYRSHFVSYLYSEVLGDPWSGQQQHRLIYRYNDTFIGVRITPRHHASEDLIGSGKRGKYYVGTSLVVDDEGSFLPPIRPFSSIEEILFAVPGIATECQGCLLADTTFFVAGDLTGLWSLPSVARSQHWDSLRPTSSALSGPLRIPFHHATVVPLEWRFTTMCPSAAAAALRSIWDRWNNQGVQPFLVLELVVYSFHDMLGGEVPLAQRPTVVLTSASLPLGKLLEQTHPKNTQKGNKIPEIVFTVNTSAADRAYAMMAADFVRYGRSHVRSVHDYIRDEARSGGALAVNGSVFLKVCVPTASHSSTREGGMASQVNLDPHCSIVSFTHSLLLMEEPYAGIRYASWYRILWGFMYYPLLLLHHVVTAFVAYAVFQQLPLQRLLLLASPQDVHTAVVGLSSMIFVASLFLCPLAERLWAALVLLLWSLVLYRVQRVATAAAMVVHGVLWTFIL